MPVFKIIHLDSQEIAIESGVDGRDACFKANWSPERCDWMEITGTILEMTESGELEIVK